MVYVEISVLAANALIHLIEKKKIREISYSQMREYGLKVGEILDTEYSIPMLLITDGDALNYLQSYSKFFDVKSFGGEDAKIILKDNFNAEDLKDYFWGGLRYEIWKAIEKANEQVLDSVA